MLRKSLAIACAAAFLSALAAGTAAAQSNNWNQRTYFTFSAPVELPGKTLPAGTYLFRLLDSPSNRHVVQVFDEHEKNILATMLAIPAQRLEPADEPEVRFLEVAADQPVAISTWWFPGRTIGHEFVYPREQAMRLAGGIKDSVLTVDSDAKTADAMRDAELARINEQGRTTAVDSTRASGDVSGTPVTGRTETQTAQQTTPPPAGTPATTVPQSTDVTQRRVDTPSSTPQRSTESVQTERTELPRTATVLPLVALIGLGSLAGAAALRLRRK